MNLAVRVERSAQSERPAVLLGFGRNPRTRGMFALGLQLAGLLAASCLPRLTHGCSIAGEPFMAFDPADYIFYGEVTEYTSMKMRYCGLHDGPCADAWGVRLRIAIPLQMPAPETREVDLFQFGLGSACEREPMSERGIRRIPIGTKFKVVAKPISGEDPGRSIPVLDGSDWSRAIMVQVARGASLTSLARSKFPYFCFGGGAGPEHEFELRKDILRLEHSRSDSESADILVRIAACHPYREGLLEPLIHEYMRDTKLIEEVRRRSATYESLEESDDAASAGETWLAIEGRPYFLTTRALRLIDDGFLLESLTWLEKAARKGYLPSQLYLARTQATLSKRLVKVDPSLAKKYAKKSKVAFTKVRQRAEKLAKVDDAMAMLVLASLYREGEAGLRANETEASRLQCLGMRSPPVDRIAELSGNETLRDMLACSSVSSNEQ